MDRSHSGSVCRTPQCRRSLLIEDHQGRGSSGRYQNAASQWDTGAAVQINLDRIRRENIFGKASRSREDILAISRQRYLVDAEVINALAVLVRERMPASIVHRILYFHAAQADPLLSFGSGGNGGSGQEAVGRLQDHLLTLLSEGVKIVFE